MIGMLPIGSIMMLGGDLRPGTKMLGLGLEIVAIAGAFGTLGALACWLTLLVTRQFSAPPVDVGGDTADRGGR